MKISSLLPLYDIAVSIPISNQWWNTWRPVFVTELNCMWYYWPTPHITLNSTGVDKIDLGCYLEQAFIFFHILSPLMKSYKILPPVPWDSEEVHQVPWIDQYCLLYQPLLCCQLLNQPHHFRHCTKTFGHRPILCHHLETHHKIQFFVQEFIVAENHTVVIVLIWIILLPPYVNDNF